jgi:hypothetical protein
MKRYSVIGYASPGNNPGVVSGILLGSGDGDKQVKMKVSVSEAISMANRGMINTTPEALSGQRQSTSR